MQYLHVHCNKSLNSHKHNWQLLPKIVKSVGIYIIFTLHARNVRLHHVLRSQMLRHIEFSYDVAATWRMTLSTIT